MYGLVNKAIEDLICNRFGDEAWERIKRRAGLEMDSFISMEGYPDELTYELVGAASEELGIPGEELLEAFGEYWTLYTAREGYGRLLEMGGASLKEFLLNLHNLHSHVALSFPNLKPPSFWCTDVTEHSIRLHYQSHRPGLAPMVIGLVKGLGKMFDTHVDVVRANPCEAGAKHDDFLIELG